MGTPGQYILHITNMMDSTPRDTRTPSLSSTEKKRTRVQLSCTACRSRKLKCCRTYPCTNCKKRGEALSCTFVGRGPRGRTLHGRTSPTLVQDRLQHLENLILSLTQKKSLAENHDIHRPEEHDGPATSRTTDDRVTPRPPSTSTGFKPKESPLDPSSKLVMENTGTSYIDGAHWTAILEEINGVREHLQESNDISDDEAFDDGHLSTPSPTLLLGLNKTVSKEDLLADIPPRPVTDRLIAQFINSKEPVLTTIHIPTFQKEYNLFWSIPQAASLSWLAFLYAILTLSIAIQRRLGEPLPVYLEDSGDIISTFRKRAAQCLVQSDYTQPGKYKVEALFYYTLGEFYRSNDAQVSVSFLLGITIRLAMRTGYHRDPRHFPSISAYEGEMRRRVWATMRQLDSLISFQVGLPRTIQDWQDDVELPRNICDEDFNEGTTHLPPSRPESELTTASYIRAKSRIMAVFGKISDLAYSREPVTYDEVLEIDRRLEEVYGLVPFNFRIRPVDQSFADPSDLILRRYTLELLYQKARCVLHRRYLGEVHSNLRYAYSRWVCMSASKEILRHQADLHHETQPGGILYRDRQFPNSLQNADYLLAAMIICLELSYDPPGEPTINSDVTVVIKGREDLLTSLEMSHQIFEQSRRRSMDAQKAYAALTVMLRRVKKAGLSTAEPIKRPPADNPDDQPVDTHTTPPPSYEKLSVANAPYSVATSSEIPGLDVVEPPFISLDVIEGMLDAPSNIDWHLWDQQVQGPAQPSRNNSLWYPDPAFSGIVDSNSQQ
ncbi:fungal-specific transcription factor domain-containing protein [Aspergillus parasiticus]|uniref:Fungal-specific transcription factor domain-containing protein n=1 Tax=Aspergillus parasiticus TaxID=5067 RepID=A0A5N6DM34_ASPPA|nr:fungal-specific transcription factor domain-containing protein [Aspergillus parasiticus]